MSGTLHAFLITLGDEIEDVDEETFHLFSQAFSLPNLGMIDPKSQELELTVAGRNFTITQSPSVLQSSRKDGTTGAAVWQTSLRVAEWLAQPDNGLFTHTVLNERSSIVELGSGIAGIVPLTLAPKVQTVVATDQRHLLKALRANIENNRPAHTAKSKPPHSETTGDIEVLALDWEEDDAQRTVAAAGHDSGVDMIVACDCIYNYALIEPFVQTCTDICQLRRDNVGSTNGRQPTFCVVANHLRQADVFEQWLSRFMQSFRVWRMPDSMLTPDLKEGSGFAVHVGLLRHVTRSSGETPSSTGRLPEIAAWTNR